MTFETAISRLKYRLDRIPLGRRAALARQAGINESSLRALLRRDLKTKTTATLARLERALDEIERDGAAGRDAA